MEKNFVKDAAKELVEDHEMEFNVGVTENGGLGYKTTGRKILDVSFMLPSLRKATEEEINGLWDIMYRDDEELAVLFLFYAGDIRKGSGERRVFKLMFKKFCEMDAKKASNFISLIPEYSRWDVMWNLIGINDEIDNTIGAIVRAQISEDIRNAKEGKPISLLAKWLPSYNTSSRETRMNAVNVCRVTYGIDISKNPTLQKNYRQMLSMLRKHLKVVEATISANEWDKVDYEAVPSKANLLYKNAFKRHDEERYGKYLEDLAAGKTKVNASVAFPCDIVHKYYIEKFANGYCCPPDRRALAYLEDEDTLLEEMWKNLPEYNIEDDDTVVVLDTSGSMRCRVGNTGNMTALEVATSVAIYFSDHSKGKYAKDIIAFSTEPSFIDLSDCKSLKDKLNKAAADRIDCGSTNIEGVFDLILNTAKQNKYEQKDIPSRIAVVSDMEFDDAFRVPVPGEYWGTPVDARVFKVIEEKFEAAGYKMPKLVFWNVNSRTDTIPLTTNEAGVILVSGFSANTMKMVLSDKTDPMEALLEILYSERYAPIRSLFQVINK